MSAYKMRDAADNLEQIAEKMQELLEQASETVKEIDELGEDIGSDLGLEFDNYIMPHLRIRLGEDGGGYMSNEKGLVDLANRAREQADELEHMVDDEEE